MRRTGVYCRPGHERRVLAAIALRGPSGVRAEEPAARAFAAGGRPAGRRRVGRVVRQGQFRGGAHGRGHFDRRHRKGRVVDSNDALDGDGPFSPERSGSVPTGQLVSYCYTEKRTHEEVWKVLVGQGGIFAYLGTNDCREVEERIRRGDAKAKEVYEAMAYQIAKWVGASAAVLSGEVKAVVITGGMARSKLLVRMIRKYAGFVAPFVVYPEVEEMVALATAAQGAVAGKIKVQEYR